MTTFYILLFIKLMKTIIFRTNQRRQTKMPRYTWYVWGVSYNLWIE